MSAPETIWANPYYGIKPHQTAGLWKIENTNSLGTQYTRSDLCITRAEADAMVLAERERCAGIVDECRFNNPMSDTVMLEIIADDIRKEPRP